MIIVIWGFGPVGTSLLELLTMVSTKVHDIFIFEPNIQRKEIALKINKSVSFSNVAVTPQNINQLMSPILQKSANKPILLFDLTSGTETLKFLEWVANKPIFYINTSFESTEHVDIKKANRQDVIKHSTVGQHRTALYEMNKPMMTCVVEAGMNPGLISHFTKVGIEKLYQLLGHKSSSKISYSQMAQTLKIKSVLCTEIDTQEPIVPRQNGEFVNTWSVKGFLSEGDEVVQIGNKLPMNEPLSHLPDLTSPIFYRQKTALEYNCTRIYRKSGFETKANSFVPSGPIYGYVIPHGESDTLACYLTEKTNQKPTYRPLTHYVYQPCRAAIESIEEHMSHPSKELKIRTLYGPDIKSHGKDEVGALFELANQGMWWFGSILTIEQTRSMGFVYSGPTAVQVAAGLYSTALWIFSDSNNQRKGLLFPEQLDSQFILSKAHKYLGNVLFTKLNV